MLLVVLAAPSGGAAAPIPNTSTASETAQLDSGPTLLQKLALPNSPSDDSPAALASLGSPVGPEEDLAAALDRLAAASTVTEATNARKLALDILEGAPLSRAYSGIPLLNWNARAKVEDVPAGGTVTVRQVRFGDHLVSDTWLLRFADPSQPFKIAYEVTELDGAFGGELTPTPLLTDGGAPAGGLHSVIARLTLPHLLTGTFATSVFHPSGAAEDTRLGVQRFVVRMPPPGNVSAILDPSLGPGHEALATLAPATAERLDAAADALGFDNEAPTTAQKRAAIDRLADTAPERQIWDALDALNPAAPGFLAAAQAAGADTRPLVVAMSDRRRLPPGVSADPNADVTVVLMNNETYVSRTGLRLPPGASLDVTVVNGDGFAHDLEALELRGRQPVFGPVGNWGAFEWGELGSPPTLAAGETQSFTLSPATNAFTVWLGDPGSGDQAATAIALERGPRTESLGLGPGFAAPLHAAEDAAGRLWITLEGMDKIVRLTPAADLTASAREEYFVPNGAHKPGAHETPLGPRDVFVDGNGIVWLTLFHGNAIARIDPAETVPDNDEGFTIYPLASCAGPPQCRPPFPPEPGVAPSRGPLQLDGMLDANGNTVVFFTQSSADRIGVLRVAPNGTQLNLAGVSCECTEPHGIALDGDGSAWFTEAAGNAIGRMRLDQAQPWSPALATIEHHPIPFAAAVQLPGDPDPVDTARPHSLALDPDGRVWFTAPAASKVAYLDPADAVPGTSAGFHSFATGATEFGASTAPAGIALDDAGIVFWTDENGDAVGVLDNTGTRTLRPAARRSSTGSPLVDGAGDLWFLESGANLITRVEAPAAGALPPGTDPGDPRDPGDPQDPDKPQDPPAAPPAAPPIVPSTTAYCKHWIVGTGRAARVQIVGLRSSAVRACLGKPPSRKSHGGGQRWRYPRKLTIDFRGRRAVAFELASPGLRSTEGRVGLGSSPAKLGALTSGRSLRRLGSQRQVILPAAAGGNVRLTATLSAGKPRRIVRLRVELVAQAADKVGRGK